MTRYVVSLAAREDLIAIWEYIAEDSEEAASRVNAEFYRAFEQLGDFPGMGSRREELAPGLRLWPVRKYNIFYEGDGDRILIKRVLHSARDVNGLFR